MLDNNLIRPLTNALTSLILLVCLSLILLGTSAFLYAVTEFPSGNANSESPKAAAATTRKVASLTEEQVRGQQLFGNNCAQCHAVSEQVIVGPGLKGVTRRTPGEGWLTKWIRNSSVVVASGDPYAVQVYNRFQKIQMSSFPNLTDADIKSILAYVDPKPTAAP